MLLCLFISPSLAAQVIQCEDPLVQVEVADMVTADRTCRRAAAARDSVSSCGGHLETPVNISVVNEIECEGWSYLGLYHCGEGWIEILAPEIIADVRRHDSAFSDISDSAYWDSVLCMNLPTRFTINWNVPFGQASQSVNMLHAHCESGHCHGMSLRGSAPGSH